jgi:hypothetical protein
VRNIAGRPAVVMYPLAPNEASEVYMRDSFSHWHLYCAPLNLEECIKITEGVQ